MGYTIEEICPLQAVRPFTKNHYTHGPKIRTIIIIMCDKLKDLGHWSPMAKKNKNSNFQPSIKVVHRSQGSRSRGSK